MEDAPAGVKSASGAGLRAIMIPDLVQPDEETMKDVWKKYNTLLDVLELLKEQEADNKRNMSGGEGIKREKGEGNENERKIKRKS